MAAVMCAQDFWVWRLGVDRTSFVVLSQRKFLVIKRLAKRWGRGWGPQGFNLWRGWLIQTNRKRRLDANTMRWVVDSGVRAARNWIINHSDQFWIFGRDRTWDQNLGAPSTVVLVADNRNIHITT